MVINLCHVKYFNKEYKCLNTDSRPKIVFYFEDGRINDYYNSDVELDKAFNHLIEKAVKDTTI